jgi:GT2 family glycosyltransferase
MQESKEISIVIVNYRSRKHLSFCVDSILDKLGSRNFEILIINNDKEEDISQDFLKLPEIRVTNSQSNIGFAAGSNAGAKLAKGKWLLFLNPDTRLLTNQAKILALMDKGGKAGIISPRLVNENGKTQKWSYGKMPGLLELFRNNVGNIADKKDELDSAIRKVDWVSGAAMFVRKETFNALEGFDENFFMYFEDIDFCKRAKEIGAATIYFPEEKIEHLGGKSVEDKRKQKKDYYASQDYYFKKHHGKARLFILRFLRKIFEKNNV